MKRCGRAILDARTPIKRLKSLFSIENSKANSAIRSKNFSRKVIGSHPSAAAQTMAALYRGCLTRLENQ